MGARMQSPQVFDVAPDLRQICGHGAGGAAGCLRRGYLDMKEAGAGVLALCCRFC